LYYRIKIYFEDFVKSVNLNIKNIINSGGLVYVDVEVKVSGKMKLVAAQVSDPLQNCYCCNVVTGVYM
jgi:hypothetical protein